MMSLGTQTVTLFYALMKKVQEMKNQLNELGTEDSVMTFIIVLLNMMLLSVPLYKAVQAKKDEIIGYYNLFMEKTGLRKEEEKVYRAGYDDDNPSRKGGLIGAAGTFQAGEVEEHSSRSYSGGPGIFGPTSGGTRSDTIVHGLPQQLSITSADQDKHLDGVAQDVGPTIDATDVNFALGASNDSENLNSATEQNQVGLEITLAPNGLPRSIAPSSGGNRTVA
mmetsp:Transcript_4261/g.6708  ORF Transcript_4261/g.6708 Transcript_4261/m.6708 type:complete len:222 (-) Transcript_4261:253-918(-)